MTDETESCEPSERSANHYGRGLTIFFTLLVCYVLSPIPVLWGIEKLGVHHQADAVFETFYAPLGYLAKHIEFVDRFYKWQCRLIGLCT